MDAAHETIWKTTEQRLVLGHLFRTAERLRELDGDLPVVQMAILFYIAMNEGATQRDLIAALDIASSTSSRSVAALSEVNRLGKSGFGLISWYDDLQDRRVKHLMLTPKGRTLVAKMVAGV